MSTNAGPDKSSPRDLYLFHLPTKILNTLTLASTTRTATNPSTPKTPAFPNLSEGGSELPTVEEEEPVHESGPQTTTAADPVTTGPQPAKATTCNVCSASFTSVSDQRSHVKSDWHRYNLKLKIQSRPGVSEEYFDRLIGDLDESISGSGGSDESETESTSEDGRRDRDQDNLDVLMKHQATISGGAQDRDDEDENTPDNALFSAQELAAPEQLVQIIRDRQLKLYRGPNVKNNEALTVTPSEVGPTYFMCMLGGGHFSAMIVALSARVNKHPKTGRDQFVPVVLAHKSFHRYTTRRKQGGSQSASDNARGAAHSAGANLRRYNEAALAVEIRDLMVAWKRPIAQADRLFIRIGRSNWSSLFGAEKETVIRRDDPRIRRFPFTTRRATQAELLRAFSLLMTVEVEEVDPQQEEGEKKAETQKKQLDAVPKTGPKSSPAEPALPEEDQELILHTGQLSQLIKRSKAPAVISYLQSNNLDANTFRLAGTTDIDATTLEMNTHTPTLLHLAASSESGAVVIALMTKAHADPTIVNGAGQTAFQLARESHTQDAFRISRHELGEQAWDWNRAGPVPDPISKAEIDRAKAEEEERTKVAEERDRREREAAAKVREEKYEARRREKEEAARRARFGKGVSVGGMVRTEAEIREADSRGLTPEMQRKLERERRAKAIEARLRQNQNQ